MTFFGIGFRRYFQCRIYGHILFYPTKIFSRNRQSCKYFSRSFFLRRRLSLYSRMDFVGRFGPSSYLRSPACSRFYPPCARSVIFVAVWWLICPFALQNRRHKTPVKRKTATIRNEKSSRWVEAFFKLQVRHGTALECLLIVISRFVDTLIFRTEQSEIVVGFTGHRVGADRCFVM